MPTMGTGGWVFLGISGTWSIGKWISSEWASILDQMSVHVGKAHEYYPRSTGLHTACENEAEKEKKIEGAWPIPLPGGYSTLSPWLIPSVWLYIFSYWICTWTVLPLVRFSYRAMLLGCMYCPPMVVACSYGVLTWLWNPGCGILAVCRHLEPSGSIWEAYRSHLEGIWEASGEPWRPCEAQGRLGGKG